MLYEYKRNSKLLYTVLYVYVLIVSLSGYPLVASALRVWKMDSVPQLENEAM